jgi:uncharacterized protein YkwD
MVKKSLQTFFQSQEQQSELTRIEILDLLNEERASSGAAPLQSNFYLDKAAQDYAKQMFEEGFFSHNAPDGTTFVDRIKAAGYLDQNPDACQCAQTFDISIAQNPQGSNYSEVDNKQCECNPTYSLGENLAKGQLTPVQAVTDWMNSPTHAANVVRVDFEEIGIGVFGDVWVNEFGKVRSSQ